MSSPKLPKLPLEILTVVIDALAASHSDINTLLESMQSASLTCSAFLPLCQRHIFASVAINHLQRPSQKPISFFEFARFFTEHSYLAKYIRELSVYLPDTAPQGGRGGDVVASLFKAFLNIDGLKSLSICLSRRTSSSEVVKWSDSLFTPAIEQLLRLPSLSRLQLSNLSEVPLDTITTNLRYLSLDQVSWKSRPELTSFDWLPPDLEALDSNYSPFTKTLLLSIRPDNQPFVSLKKLARLQISGIEESLETCRIAASKSESLASIYLKTRSRESFNGLYDAILPSFTTLQHLVIGTSVQRHDPDPYQHACEELQKITNTNIQSITFQVHLPFDSIGTTGDGWDQIDGLFTSEVKWPSLKDVRLEVRIWRYMRPKSTFDVTMQKLTTLYFKKLLASNRIHFVYECHDGLLHI
ncbi:hypothetical protein CPB83DRAFT_861383 [Crepidotus variabilis]|uniref:Uncharacterized protein n=1 Tax=Crepidotus variabilis TaxID=179855 RepID=A0A9P6E8A2_9AGAR|nr:hypothetical protein CPB83DRAFT_861383 [Crepidotus variabilis]